MGRRVRFCTFVVLVFVFLHLCGASAQVVTPGIITWYFGPCALNRPMGKTTMTVSCYNRQVVQVWPVIGGQAVRAGR